MQTRQLEIDHTRADDEQRTAPCTLSTEYPVDRGDYFEVLAHDSDSVDLSRAPLPLIESHDATRLNIGVVENLNIENRKLRGTVRLGDSNRAKELWPDIKAGIVRNLSIGYRWDDYKTEGDAVRVTRWAPHELSLTGCPADPGAGLYRNLESEMETEVKTETRSDKRRANRAASDERERILTLNELVRVHKKHAPEYERSPSFIRALEAEAQRLVEDGGNPDILSRWMNDNKPRSPSGPSPAHGPVEHLVSTGREIRGMYNGGQSQAGNNLIQPISQKQLRHFGENTRDQQANAYRAGQWIRATLLGHETVVSDAMPSSTGDLSDVGMLAFGNFSQAATMGLRRDISMKVDDSRYLEYDQIAVRAIERFDVIVHELGDNTDAGSVVVLVGE